ncbi:MAG: hypothetical protein LAO76_19430 [Acidobacteriia bacterium]|nr:hypothetical protein [Terriglobia bacterium]
MKDWKETLTRKCSILWIAFFLLLATMAHAQVTSLSLFSDPGDFVGDGQNALFTPADGTFSVQASANDNVIGVHFVGQPGVFWDLEFAACCGAPLAAFEQYFGAQTWPTQPSFLPGMLISGDGRTCDAVTGNFTFRQLSFNPDGSVASLDVIFVQQCDGEAPALSGEIRFGAVEPIYISSPPHQVVPVGQTLTFTVSAIDAQGGHVALSAPVPAGGTLGSFVDNGDNTGTFTWTPNITFFGTKTFFNFTATDSAGNSAFAPIEIDVIAPQPQTPPNDDFNHATVAPSVPFTTSQDVSNATVAPDDPFCVNRNQTVWFAFTPTQNMRLEANTIGSDYDTTLGVYTGTRGALNQIGCDDDSNGTLQSTVRFDAVAGVTYYFEVSSFSTVSPADLVFNLVPSLPPLAITPSVTKFGTVDPTTGTATITGSVSCTKQAFVTLSGQLKQTHGNTPITGFFSVFVPCDGITPWNATIQTVATLFHGRSVALFTGGKADISATATAFDFDSGETVEQDLAVTITLRGKN